MCGHFGLSSRMSGNLWLGGRVSWDFWFGYRNSLWFSRNFRPWHRNGNLFRQFGHCWLAVNNGFRCRFRSGVVDHWFRS